MTEIFEIGDRVQRTEDGCVRGTVVTLGADPNWPLIGVQWDNGQNYMCIPRMLCHE